MLLLGPAQTIPASQCNTGNQQCCQSVQSSSSHPATGLLSLLGVVLEGLDVPIGMTCSGINVLGLGGNSCTAQPVWYVTLFYYVDVI